MPERRKLAQGRRRHRAKSRCCCFFSVSIFFSSFPGRKGAGSGGEENSSYRLKVFLLCLVRLRDFHAKPLSFAHTRLRTYSHIHDTWSAIKRYIITSHIVLLISLGHATSNRQETDQIILLKMYLCTFIRVKANAGKGGNFLGYDGIWGRWRLQGLERTYLLYRKE